MLGQLQDPHAVPILTRVLENTAEDPMVRHEAAEALGAIGQVDSIPLLERYKNDTAVEVAETCEIALDRIRERQAKVAGQEPANPYGSVDPAPPSEPGTGKVFSVLARETSLGR